MVGGVSTFQIVRLLDSNYCCALKVRSCTVPTEMVDFVVDSEVGLEDVLLTTEDELLVLNLGKVLFEPLEGLGDAADSMTCRHKVNSVVAV